MKYIFIILFFTLSYSSYSQKEGNIWYFGVKAGLDFNTGAPVVLKNSAMFAFEGCSSISDKKGNLLFYTDGITVWNKKNQVMLNGSGLNSIGTATQSGLVVPLPGSNNIYYIFSQNPLNTPTEGLYYSIADMTLDSGLGGISQKNILLVTNTVSKITAVNHSNKRAIWIITHGSNNDTL